jgi:hypothetical protein
LVEETNRRTLAKAVDQYGERASNKQKLVAAEVYRTSLTFLQQALPDVLYVDQLTEDALLKFHAYLRKRGNSERTISNRHGHVKSLMLWCGVSREQICKKIGGPPSSLAAAIR